MDKVEEMKFVEANEIGMGRLLYYMGFRYMVRSEMFGLIAYVNKPSKKIDDWYAPGKFCWLDENFFTNVSVDRELPTEILKNGKTRVAKNRI